MGFFDSLNKFLVENVPVGPTISDSETNHIYYSSTVGEIRKDIAYMSEFNQALEGLCSRRKGDTYLSSISRGSAVKATIVRIDKEGGHAVRWSVRFACGKSITLWLETQNATQLKRDGKALSVGYSVIYNYEEQEKVREREEAERAAQQQRQIEEIDRRRKELASKPPLESFLGVKFGDDAEKYRNDDNPKENDDGFVVMKAKANKFLDFTDCVIFASKFNNKVVWIMAIAQKSELGDVDEYVHRVSRLLEQKYERNFIKEDDMLILPFYDAEKWDTSKSLRSCPCKSMILLFPKGDLLCLVARDEILSQAVEKQNAIEKAEADVREAEAKKAADKDALAAL